MTEQHEPAEAPLDPATERLRRKMVRLLTVSVGIMLIGVMAVLVAVVYRTSEAGDAGLEAGATVPIVLPATGEILETGIDGDRVLIRLAMQDGTQELVVVERQTGAVLSRHPIAWR